MKDYWWKKMVTRFFAKFVTKQPQKNNEPRGIKVYRRVLKAPDVEFTIDYGIAPAPDDNEPHTSYEEKTFAITRELLIAYRPGILSGGIGHFCEYLWNKEQSVEERLLEEYERIKREEEYDILFKRLFGEE